MIYESPGRETRKWFHPSAGIENTRPRLPLSCAMLLQNRTDNRPEVTGVGVVFVTMEGGTACGSQLHSAEFFDSQSRA